jgi:hypothetical protein
MDKAEFDEWLKDRPQSIKDLSDKLKPWLKYRIKETGQHCDIAAYNEKGSVRVLVNGHDDEFLDVKYFTQPVFVFGVKPSELELINEQ